jgi:DNA-binding response OmpR family regulator
MSASILVIEDDSVIRELVNATLAGEGYRVSQAAAVPAALDLLESEGRFDLVVLDLMLGRETGWDIVRHLDTSGQRPHTRLLVLSARASQADVLDGWERGVDGYLTKPFGVEDLVDAVEDILAASEEELADRRRRETHRAKYSGLVEDVLAGWPDRRYPSPDRP